MATKQLSIKYVGDATSLKNTLSQIDKAHATLATKLQSIGRSMYSTGRSATIGMTLPIVAGFKVAIDEATQFNQVNAQTQAALKSTGGSANVTADHITQLSTKLGDLTAVDGEVVHSMENILLTFPAVRNEVGKGNQIFDRASLAVENLSARMGTDLNSAATFVGKALGNPIKGLTALTRVGVEFDAQQIKTITHLTESGHVMQAQKVILAELNKEFGGSAKAMGDAASPLTKLNLAFRDLAQQIGPILIKIIEGLTTKLQSVFKWVSNLSPGMQHLAVTVALVLAAIGPVLIVMGSFIRVTGLMLVAVDGLGLGLARLGTAFQLMAAFGVESFTIMDVATKATLIGAVLGAVILVAVLIVTHWKQVKAVTIAVWHAITHALAAAWNWITDTASAVWKTLYHILSFTPFVTMFKLAWAGIKAYFQSAFAVIKAIVQGGMAVIRNVIIPAMHTIAGVIHTVLHTISAAWHAVWGTFGGVVINVMNTVVGAVKTGINGVIHTINALIHAYNVLPGHADIPTIPALARGTRDWAGGMAWIGEKGAELVELPRGSNVYPHAQSMAMAGGGGGDTYFTFHIAGSVVTERDLVETIRAGLIQLGRRNGGVNRLGLS